MRLPRSRVPFRILLVAATLALALLAAPPSAAAPSSGPLSSLRDSIGGLDDPQQQAATELLDGAEADRARATELQARREALLAEAAAAPERIQRLNAQLEVDRASALARWRAGLPEDAGVETLEGLLENERAAAAKLRDRIAALSTELSQAISATEADSTGVERERRIEALAVPTSTDAGEPPALAAARRARAEAELARLQAERALEQTGRELAGTRQRLIELELRALRHQLAGHEPRRNLLQQRIANLGRQELRALVAALEAASVPAAGPLVAETARGNLRLGHEMLQVNEALADDRRALADEDQALERDVAALRDSRTRLELGGRSEQIGIWLWAEMRRLEPERRLHQRLDEARQELAALRLRLIALNEIRRDLGDVGEAVQDLRAAASVQREEDAVDDVSGPTDPLAALLDLRVELVDRLEPLLWRRIATLEQTERSVQARIDANTELRQTLDRHLLWIRSHPRIDLDWLSQVPEGAADLVKPSRLATTARLLHESFARRPGAFIGSLALLVLLLVLRRRAPARLDQLAQAIRDVRRDRYRRTLESLAWTLAATLPGPTAAYLFGRLLQDVGTGGKYSDSLGRAFVAVALPMLTLVFLGWLARERGLAHAHFRWTRQRREAIRHWLPHLTALLLPLYFLVALAFFRNQDLAISVQARIALVLSSTVFAAAFWWLLAPERVWHARGRAEPQPLRRVLRGLLPAAGLAGALLALDGYVYSTAILQNSLLASIGVVTAVAVVHGLLSRWFVLGERRLALRRYLKKRAEDAGDGAPEDGGEAIPQELNEEVTLEKVGANSRALLRALKLTLLVLGLASVWAGVLPAFARFDEIALWTFADVDAAGVAVRSQVTLWSVMLGSVVLALTVVAARNLPGLIEIGLLSRSGIDAASRYAITSVSRYVIVVVGVVAGFGLFGLRWGQLQWMAAALTVGLGFGLQEIFANFVSGLILLFERPFRVGDTITVNNLDGTVTRIRTRATTILDFDNKEIVVPNKAFITGQLVNWTLTDEVMRVIVKVGVDYDTDPKLVQRLLMQAAEENARVLKDRPMRSWLLNFGDNALDFELRVFVSLADRLVVRDELNMRVVELFAEHDIGFAYPQLDVHVRDLPPPQQQSTTPTPLQPPPSPAVNGGPG